MQRLRHIVAALAVCFSLITVISPTSASAYAPTGGWDLLLSEIGGPLSTDIAFSPLTIDIPVVAGLRPTSVSGKAAVAGSLPSTAGMYVREQGWSINVATGAFTVPITDDQALTLVLETNLSELVTCDGGAVPQVVVSDLLVRYDGDAVAPDHVGSFFPPALRRTSIVIPPDAPIEFSTAALRVTTSLTRRYARAADVTIVNGRPADERFSPFERFVVLREGSPASMSIEAGALVLTGDGEQLIAMADRLDDPFLKTITTARFAAGTLPPPVETRLIGDSFSMDRIRTKAITTTSSATLQLSVDEEMFEKPPSRISLKLSGRAVVTGVAQGAASVTVRVDGEAIQSDPLDASGRFTASLEINGFDHRRVATVAIEVAVNRTGCTGSVPSIELNQKSSGKVTAYAQPPTGFPGITRRWKSKPAVGINPGTLPIAAAILASIQEASPNPIHATAVASMSSSVILGFGLTAKSLAEIDVAATPIGQVDGLARVMPDGTLVIRMSSADGITRLLETAKKVGWSGIEGDLIVLEDDGSESVSWQQPPPELSRKPSGSSGSDTTNASDKTTTANGLTPLRSAVLGGGLCVVLLVIKQLTAKRRS
jgi:hypothetical protein